MFVLDVMVELEMFFDVVVEFDDMMLIFCWFCKEGVCDVRMKMFCIVVVC